jgi:hypothetical protein
MRACVSNRDLAITYLEAFCAGDLSRLDSLLSENLTFRGPFHTFSSASEYMDSLRCDPPDKCGFEICSITEDENTVAVFYENRNPTEWYRLRSDLGLRNNE